MDRVSRVGSGTDIKLQIKNDGLLGIDLKKVSLKRKIKNDDSKTEVYYHYISFCKIFYQMGGFGQIKRVIPNKKEKNSSDEEVSPRKSGRSIMEKEKGSGRAIYKTALNGKIIIIIKIHMSISIHKI